MKPCPSFTGYSVTADGQVFSHRRRGKRIAGHGGSESFIDPTFAFPLSQTITRKGYKTVTIVVQAGRKRPVGVHQLVADAFIGPAEGRQVRHLNGDPADNSPDNLAYGDAFDNAQDRLEHGRYSSGSAHHNAVFTEEQVKEVRALREQRMKVKDIASRFKVSVSAVEGVLYKKSYKN